MRRQQAAGSVGDAFQAALRHHKAGQSNEAETICRSILKSQPSNSDALHLLGLLAYRRRDLRSAEAFLQRAVDIDERNVGFLMDLATVLGAQGRLEEAVTVYVRALEIEPTFAEGHFNLGLLFRKLNKLDEAVASYRRALENRPDYAEAYGNLGNVFLQQGRLQDAVANYRRAIEIKPLYANAHMNLGTALRDQGALDEAIASFRRSLELSPENAQAHFNLGLALTDLGQIEEGARAYRRALEIQPDYAMARFNLSLYFLAKGELVEGWELYEWRRRTEPAKGYERFAKKLQWDGGVLEDGTLLLYAEQGIGDEVFFASLLKDVQERCENILLECDPRLAPTFQRSFPNIGIVPNEPGSDKTTLPSGVTAVCPIGTLPKMLRRSFEDFAKQTQLIKADGNKVREIHEKIGKSPGQLTIGLSWRTSGRGSHFRNIELSHLLECLSGPGHRFVNLQYGDHAKEIDRAVAATGASFLKLNEIDKWNDIETLLALMEVCDLVVSIDNSTVHFAGSLNRPVWSLLSFPPNWRWGLAGEISPWYPTMRLFRQTVQGDWHPVTEQVARALSRFQA